MKQAYTLSPDRTAAIKRVLAPYADKIRLVGVFGSHALATARPNSDVDLVIYGDLDDSDVDRIWTLMDESGLPVTVDILAYNLSIYPPLRDHIDRSMKPLFTHEDLLTEKIA